MTGIEKNLVEKYNTMSDLMEKGIPYKTIKQFAFQRKIDPVDILGLNEKLIFAKDAADLAYEKYKKEMADYENEFQRTVMVHMTDEIPPRHHQWVFFNSLQSL